MGVLTTRLAAKPVAATELVDKAPWFQQWDVKSWWDTLSLGVVLVGVALVLSTFRDYGVTWDEDVHNWYGNFVLDYYLSFFGDKTALHWRDLYNYGAVFDMAAAALNRVSPIGVYETRHLLNGLVGILGLISCWKLGGAVARPRAGFIACLLLISIPNYYGQMFNNPKDIPFAVGVVWSTYYMIRIVPTLPRPPLGTLAKLGFAIGMTMGVRIGGLLLLFYLSLLLALDGTWRAVFANRIQLLASTAWVSLWRILLPVVGIAYPAMVLFGGMLYFLFILPLLAGAAAVAADRGHDWLARFPYRRLVWGVLAIYGCAHISLMAMLHPDQYVYYSAFVGGVEGAQHKFKLDYWANSYAEAVQGLENYLRTEYGADFEEREFTVAVCGPSISADYYFPPNFRFTRR